MGIKVLWIVFGAATFYVVGALLVPVAITVLWNSGVAIAGDTVTQLSRLTALVMAALGGTLGLRHAQKVEARRSH
jgi:hypothetical protein